MQKVQYLDNITKKNYLCSGRKGNYEFWILNFELGKRGQLWELWGVSHTGDYGTCRTGAKSRTNGTGRTGREFW